ncbi:MAG TPA: hypothetical protein VEG30_09060 [Terriglobales bacterium]|nr:hypothetical protein [Terriglobales bacterium]
MKIFDRDLNTDMSKHAWSRKEGWMLWAPMLGLQTPDPALQFPASTKLQPYVFVRNLSAKPTNVQMRLYWRSASSNGATPPQVLTLKAGEMQKLDVVSQFKNLPKEANWATVSMLTNSGPDEVIAVAASYDDTGRYGVQTPFTDQMSAHWEGGAWEVDDAHNTLITVGNGGRKDTHARMIFHYVTAKGHADYVLEQKLAQDEQLFIDLGKLIRSQTPDAKGNVFPTSITSGSYTLLDLDDKMGNVFEGKVVTDKRYGDASYGCMQCCGVGVHAYLDQNPIGVGMGLSFSPVTVTGMDGCTDDFLDATGFFNSWWTADASIATAQYSQSNGISVGSTTTLAQGQVPRNSLRTPCHTDLKTPQSGTNVPPQFNVAYSDYIGVDWINGPSYCYYQGNSNDLIYMGDAYRGTYRATESLLIIPDLQTYSGFFKGVGQSRNYGAGSPANGSTLSAADEDGIPNDCHLWNASGFADTSSMGLVTSFPYAHQGQVEYSGAAQNPLESTYAPITWDMRTVLDTTNPQSPTAYANYNHTCFPSHQIKVNNAVIYLYTPSRYDLTYITYCLYFQYGKITGQTTATTVPPQ